MSALVEVNTVQFEAGMQKLRRAVRAGLVDPAYGTLGVQGRLLAEHCQNLTPPKDLAQGRRAVARDINRAFQPITTADFDKPSIKRIIRTDDRDAWRDFAMHVKSKDIKDSEAISFDPAWHQRQRKSRGRVLARPRVVTLGPEANKVGRYIRETQARVGWAKAGWNIAIISLGGRIKDAWVARHSVNRGRFIDGRTGVDPYVHAINTTGWGRGGKESERIVRSAISARVQAMQTYINTQMKLAVAKATSGTPTLPIGM